MKDFFDKAALQNNPLKALFDFLETEQANEIARKYDEMRFVGYVLEIGFDTVTIITSDPFKIAVGGVPRNSLLIMVPADYKSFPPHFTLLRVLESAPTPLSKEVQQTYFELQKKSMPELDVFTQSELQWGALRTSILGMFYPHPDNNNLAEFSGDLNNFVSAHKYRVYSPNENLLEFIANALVPAEHRFPIGELRLTECRLPLPKKSIPKITVFVSAKDFIGARTAMFGKTRLGKSNIIKLIAQSLIETTKETNNVGQLIFDINGEYANDNPQDDTKSLRSVYKERCVVYALSKKEATESRPLKLNFYQYPHKSKRIIGSLLEQDGRSSGYVKSFASVELPSIEEINNLQMSDKIRAIRKIQIYWAILKRAGYSVDEGSLKRIAPHSKVAKQLNPGFNNELRTSAYQYSGKTVPSEGPDDLDTLINELEVINKFRRENPNDSVLMSQNNKPLFDPDDCALLDFLDPLPGRSGTSLIQPYRMYHDHNAGDFINEIIELLESGMTVILDLGNANPEIMGYFSDELSMAVFRHQVEKFSNNKLGNHYIQLYFEEAHNLFPQNADVTTIYSRLAKEGAKYHIGMVYSTQSPTTINKDLLAQTENFFVAHLSSVDDVNLLAKVNIAYESLKEDILRAKTVGYIRMLTRSHRFVISVQSRKFTPLTDKERNEQNAI